MKKTGIWLDKKKALIVTIKDGKESLKTILSNVEDYHVHGGSGTRQKGGPQDVVQDSKYLEREKHQLKQYFTDVVNYLNNTEELAIFGPAETFLKLQKHIETHHKWLIDKIKTVQRVDSMTNNQIKALVRNFYTEHS